MLPEINMIDNQAQLWNFTFVAHLHKSIDLVRSNVNGQMMVRRISPAADLPVLAALCRIRQRNLMEVYDVRPENGVCVSLCEFINGTTLPERLYDVKTAKQILCQICDGLTALHSRGIVHRDIKPENIMLLSDGTVKIIDYSISRLMKPNQRKDTTTFGTAGYAPPEQFGFAQTSGTADIYSCGVLLNYMLTGRLPSEELHQGVLQAVIEQCIEIDEAKRFRSAAALKSVLLGHKINTRRPFQPLPGFRGKRVFPKVITSVGITAWLFMLLVYVTGFSGLLRTSTRNIVQQLLLMADIMVFWTALPYILFGDMFRLSERINPDNPQNGKYVLRILGAASILLGVALLVAGVYVTDSLPLR